MPAPADIRLLTDSLRLAAPPPDLAERLARPALAWDALLTHADRHSLTPLLAAEWRRAGLWEAVPPAARARLARAHADNGARNAHIRAELVEVQALLDHAGVPQLVLKGWPLVERLYADPAERVLYDHDLLVPAEHAAAGHAALRAAGFRPLPAKDAWVEKHLPPLWRNAGYAWDGYLFDPLYPRPVELHIGLWETGWRGLAVRALPDPWLRAVERPVAGVPMRVLGDEDTLVHLAMHFAGHLVEREARLNQLLDVARFQTAAPLDWNRVLALADAAGVSRFVYAALWLAHALFGAPLPPVWPALAAAAPPQWRAWLETEGADDTLTSHYQLRGRGQDYRLTFLAAESWRERAGVLRFAALPPLGQLQAKYHLAHPWQAALAYPRHVAERVWVYARGALAGRREGAP